MTVNQNWSTLTTDLRKYLNKRKGNIVLRNWYYMKLLEGKSEDDGYYTHHKKNKMNNEFGVYSSHTIEESDFCGWRCSYLFLEGYLGEHPLIRQHENIKVKILLLDVDMRGKQFFDTFKLDKNCCLSQIWIFPGVI